MSAPSFEQRARRLRLLLLDVDGVLTDGRLYFSEQGDELKAFCTADGLGVKLLARAGVRVGLITGRRSELVARRAQSLGLDPVIQGREDKWQALNEWLAGQSLSLEAIGFMGDDWPDLPVMTRVGLALTVADAQSGVAERAHWQSGRRGGEGAVREACEQLLRARGEYEPALERFLNGEGH